MKKVQEYILALRARWMISKALFMRESFELSGDTKKGTPSKLQVLCNVILCLLLEFGQTITRWRIRRRFVPAVLSPSQNVTLNNFAGKVLVHGGNNAERILYASELSDPVKFDRIIGELESREACLTDDGFAFLKDFYGLKNLAEILHQMSTTFPGQSMEENLEWLESLKSS